MFRTRRHAGAERRFSLQLTLANAKKPFLLRVPPELLDELRAWAQDEMRSLNGHIEFVLRDALRRRGRRVRDEDRPPPRGDADPD